MNEYLTMSEEEIGYTIKTCGIVKRKLERILDRQLSVNYGDMFDEVIQRLNYAIDDLENIVLSLKEGNLD